MSMTGMETEIKKRGYGMKFSTAPSETPKCDDLTLELIDPKGEAVFSKTLPVRVRGKISRLESEEHQRYELIRTAEEATRPGMPMKEKDMMKEKQMPMLMKGKKRVAT